MSPIVVRGNDFFAHDGSTRVGQMRSGTFVIEDDEKDKRVKGTYAVEIAGFGSAALHGYGHVSSNGTHLSFTTEGISFRLRPQRRTHFYVLAAVVGVLCAGVLYSRTLRTSSSVEHARSLNMGV
eukprot:UN4788